MTISLWRGSYTNISYRPDGIERDHTGKYRHPSNQGVAKVTFSKFNMLLNTLYSAKPKT